jgi:drug/metabolite transporter (DMT)-like permease
MTEANNSPQQTNANQRRFTAIFWLAGACVCWGWSFTAMPMATKALMPRSGDGSWALLAVVATFIAWRFWLAAALYAGLNWRSMGRFSRADLVGGMAVGLTFVGGLFLQMSGLRYALPSVSGFITSMPVILLPLIQAFWLKHPPRALMWLAVGLALSGLVIFGSSPEPAQATPPFRLCGELLTLCGTLFFTAQILCLDRFGPHADPGRLTVVMFITTATVATIVSLATPGGASFWGQAGFEALSQEAGLRVALLTTVVFSSAVAFHLMNHFQPRVTPTMAGVVYCLEPVFATLWSLGMGVEEMRLPLAKGGACILAALVIATYAQPPTAGEHPCA